jgi:hypothetical protein
MAIVSPTAPEGTGTIRSCSFGCWDNSNMVTPSRRLRSAPLANAPFWPSCSAPQADSSPTPP